MRVCEAFRRSLWEAAVQGLEKRRTLLETEPLVRAELQRSVGRFTERF